jgi:mono/diheme cytochrome c family protein
MCTPPKGASALLRLVLCSLAALSLIGCKKTASGLFAAGRKVFESNGCARCHTIGSPGAAAEAGPMAGGPGVMMARGPDLGQVGVDPAHTRQWLADHIRKPTMHKPQSRMPAYDGKIKEDDLLALADYLASLK